MVPLLNSLVDARAVLIAGPTASGKSALALDVAETAARQGRAALVVNADAMQVYGDLRCLTARPGPADEMRAPHRLFGHVSAATRYSVGAWLADAQPIIREAGAAGTLVILVGGTGLYFKAVTEGLVVTPDIPEAVRRKWMARLAADGAAALHEQLRIADPVAAASLRPGDGSRIARALEVVEATGRTLGSWQQERAAPLLPLDAGPRIVLEPNREELYRRIGTRFDTMVANGALAEVEALLRRDLDPDLPAMKAIGVRAFAAFLQGRSTLTDAVDQAKRETRRYAKRQMTWFRNQMPDWRRIAS